MRRPLIPGRFAGHTLPFTAVIVVGDSSTAVRTPQAWTSLIAHPAKIRFDLGEFACGSALPQLLFEPRFRPLIAFAVITAIHTAAQRQNVCRVPSGAIRAR